MATITSTIKLVDQMTPTLNKISKAIDRVNARSKAMGNVKTWNGFNAGARTATKSTHSLYNALRRTAFILGSLKGLQSFANVADTMMNANARINNITNDLEKTKYYMDAIYLSAQRSRSAFMTTANSVGKLATLAGSAFDGSMEQVIAFTELMNKMFVISGASAAEASNAMYQLTQAMAAGKLQGDEMRSILENAPMLAQKLAEKLGVSVGEIKELGAEGKITAEIIKDALFESADEIEKKFENMPKTIGQTWTEISNYALNAFRPVIDRVQRFINSPIFEKFKSKLFGIITKVANGIIRLFEILESPRMQNAIGKVCEAFSALWEIASWVGNAMVNVATWICDNWSWLGQIVYAVIAAVLLYKAVMLAVSAASVIAEIAMGIAGWVSALMAGQAWALVILIIVALIAIIYLGVAAWNYFTGSTISATGALFAVIAFVVSGVIWLFQVIWNVLKGLWAGIVFIAQLIWQVFVDLLDFFIKALTNLIMGAVLLVVSALGMIIAIGKAFVQTLIWIVQCAGVFLGNVLVFAGKILLALVALIVAVGANIVGAFLFALDTIITVIANILIGLSGCVTVMGAYFVLAKAKAAVAFWGMASSFASSIDSMITGANEGVKQLITPIINFANKCIDIFNKIADAWNNSLGAFSTTFTNPLTGKETTLGFGKITKKATISLDGGIDGGSTISDIVSGKLASAEAEVKSAQSIIDTGVDWGKLDLPNISDYTDIGGSADIVKGAWNAFDYFDFPEFTADWGGVSGMWGELGDLWGSVSWLDLGNSFKASDYADIWGDYKSVLDDAVNPDNYINPIEIAKNWYDKGSKIEGGLNGLVDGIGAILDGLFGGGGSGNSNKPLGELNRGQGTGGSGDIPSSLEDLLGGYGGGGGLGDALGAIKDNTGSSAGSAGNIEDTLDMAEEELELLRKIAEQEVINRFTTAEIKVDMTNNNNISSKMDLDGIVTHLSNKLYEELGVVASGVHY